MLDESAFKSASLCVVGNINRDIKTAPMPSGDFLLRDGETSVDVRDRNHWWWRSEQRLRGGGVGRTGRVSWAKLAQTHWAR